MFTYSSEQFYRDWRYKVVEDFKTDDGDTYPYVEGGHVEWGAEDHKLTLPTKPSKVAINTDASILAVAVEHDIHVFSTEDYRLTQVLKGHISRIDTLAFQPGNPNILVSAATNDHAGSVRADCEIIFWNPKQRQAQKDALQLSEICQEASDNIAASIAKGSDSIELADTEISKLSEDIEQLVTTLVTRHMVSDEARIAGRLLSHFDTHLFDPSGTRLMYLPGNRPRSNSDARWDMRVLSMQTREDLFTLVGHTDAIMWSGFSPDETMIGTCCWDSTMRIWDSQDGSLKFKFETGKQNWNGSFSPNSKFFAGTAGDGTIYLYSTLDGSTLWSRQSEIDWCRHSSWTPDSRLLAIGGRRTGTVLVINVNENTVVQRRVLSIDACKVDEERKKRLLRSYLEVYAVRYVDAGKKLAVYTGGDGGIEVYDFEKQQKWRFARFGTDEDLHPCDADVQPKGSPGLDMIAWNDLKNGRIKLTSLDDNNVRIWSVPLDHESI
ncbi:hypothetical protein PV08_07696 [Exophiala spinifera]|uniref:Uncharacterized protein n=1 Tax=Exophiala spinifera TaxID=91928 RepID=A0A0D1YIZ6_9EURO|nr:uncharacterized protein PV08_07696 [Exophiala spinifera]KIW14911.1 hypothetical protein PV08_07696 [Exophiala spinifera]